MASFVAFQLPKIAIHEMLYFCHIVFVRMGMPECGRIYFTVRRILCEAGQELQRINLYLEVRQ